MHFEFASQRSIRTQDDNGVILALVEVLDDEEQLAWRARQRCIVGNEENIQGTPRIL
jgi:hypothetical protein